MKIRRLSENSPKSFTVDKEYEVTGDNRDHWSIEDDNNRSRAVRKVSEYWEVVPDVPDVPDVFPVFPKISTVTRKGYSAWFTQGATYRVLRQEGSTVHIETNNGNPYSFDAVLATVWTAQYDTPLGSEEPVMRFHVNSETNEPNEPSNQTKPKEQRTMNIKIEQNVTIVNDRRADVMDVNDFLSLISRKQEELATLEGTQLNTVSKVITGKIQRVKQDISALIEVMDAQHSEKPSDTGDTEAPSESEVSS